MEREEQTELLEQAAQYREQGRNWARREEPGKAELAYRRTLRIYDRLLEMTGEKDFARTAREVCTDLADLNMQQGNMHGADFYYVKAMDYGRRLRVE